MTDEATTPDEVVSTLDMLMNLDPLALSEQDIDKIILYQRRHRQNLEGGAKPTRKALKTAAAVLDENRVDLADLIKAAIPKPTIGRRNI